MRTRSVLVISAVFASLFSAAGGHAVVQTILEAHPMWIDVIATSPGNTFGWDTQGFVSATLTDADGNPVSGREIDFSASGEPLCSALTDENGYATCQSSHVRGYRADFAGDADYAASSGEGVSIRITNGTPGVRVIFLGDSTFLDVGTF